MRSIAGAGEATKLSPLMSPAVPPSVWHSPVPYLFGGLAAVLGLVGLSLLMLACSYRRHAGRRLDERERRSSEMDLESGGEANDAETKVPKVYEEKVLVIMAGDDKPMFLATPVRAKAASCGEGNHDERDDQKKKKKKGDKAEKFDTTKKEADDDEDEVTWTEENTVVSTSQQETPELAQGHNQL